MQSVAYQQLNGTAAATILGRVKALYPGRRFPAPEDLLAMPDERLRGAGLSRAKVAAIKDIAAKTLDGTVPTSRAIARMKDADIITQLHDHPRSGTMDGRDAPHFQAGPDGHPARHRLRRAQRICPHLQPEGFAHVE